jgi:hypothetical protein
LSRAFAGGVPVQDSRASENRIGVKTPREELKLRAKALFKQGISYGHIGKILGISKTMAWDLVNE